MYLPQRFVALGCPISPEWLVGVPSPVNTAIDTIFSVEELEKLFQEQCTEYKDTVLDSDTKLSDCGYIDTTNGCVMKSETLIDIAHTKSACDLAKRTHEQQSCIDLVQRKNV